MVPFAHNPASFFVPVRATVHVPGADAGPIVEVTHLDNWASVGARNANGCISQTTAAFSPSTSPSPTSYKVIPHFDYTTCRNEHTPDFPKDVPPALSSSPTPLTSVSIPKRSRHSTKLLPFFSTEGQSADVVVQPPPSNCVPLHRDTQVEQIEERSRKRRLQVGMRGRRRSGRGQRQSPDVVRERQAREREQFVCPHRTVNL